MNVASKVETPRPLLLTVDDYRTLADAGAFEGRPKVELIDGVILTVSPQRNWHQFVESELGRRLGNKLEQLGLPLRAVVEGTVALSRHNVPEPDVTVSSGGDPDEYMQPDAALLMVEVADTSARFDLGRKKRLYSEHRVPEYWVVTRKLIYRFWTPTDEGYQNEDTRPFGTAVESATIAGLAVETSGII
jgi:Uma2 family endonuclease